MRSQYADKAELPPLPTLEDLMFFGPRKDIGPIEYWRYGVQWREPAEGVHRIWNGNGGTPERAVADLLFAYARSLESRAFSGEQNS